jgi:hypothetical protein
MQAYGRPIWRSERRRKRPVRRRGARTVSVVTLVGFAAAKRVGSRDGASRSAAARPGRGDEGRFTRLFFQGSLTREFPVSEPRHVDSGRPRALSRGCETEKVSGRKYPDSIVVPTEEGVFTIAARVLAALSARGREAARVSTGLKSTRTTPPRAMGRAAVRCAALPRPRLSPPRAVKDPARARLG